MEQFFIPANEESILNDNQWDNYTLVMPCVSVGNVPQLSVDLLINSLLPSESKNSKHNDLEFVGYIRSKYVHPFAGPDPYKFSGSTFSTSIQVFESKSKKLVVIQQRSPIYKEFRKDFYKDLTQWIMRHKFSLILFMSTSFDHYIVPDSFDRDHFPINYLSLNLDPSFKNFLEDKLNLKMLPKVDPYSLKPDPNGKIYIPGSGSARSYLKWLTSAVNNRESEIKTNVVCLVMFCSEGDNRLHSFKLADKMADVLNRGTSVIVKLPPNRDADGTVETSSLVQNVDKASSAYTKNALINENLCTSNEGRYEWTIPFSWRMMFGDEPPSEMF